MKPFNFNFIMMKIYKKNYSFLSIFAISNCLIISSCQKQTEDSTLYKLLNPKYKHDTIHTVNVPDNQKIIDDLNKELDKNDMAVTAYDTDKTKPEYNFIYDCVNNVKYHIEKKAMRSYSVKSDFKKIKHKKKHQSNKQFISYYEEFKICIYEFENEKVAKQNFDVLENVSNSGNGNCNRAFHTKYVLKKNEIFEFETMSEKSLKAMRKYIIFVQNQ